jgi:hypothetical protein
VQVGALAPVQFSNCFFCRIGELLPTNGP